MYKTVILLIALFLSIYFSLHAQEKSDSILFVEKVGLLQAKEGVSGIELFIEIGKSFIGTPYKAATLETGGAEMLVVNLHELDCTTFIENCLALTRTFSTGKTDFEIFQQQLTAIRYRNGKLNGYTSRLHYFTEWIADNASKGYVRDVTQELGGIPYPVHLNFMSTHPQYYRQLKADSTLITVIARQEENISKKKFHYIPKEKVVQLESKLKEGMIVGITTGKEGLDIAHTGMLIKQNGRIHLLHASSDFKQVMISNEPLSDYLMGNKSQTGIMVMEVR
jgi:hypothetical protein